MYACVYIYIYIYIYNAYRSNLMLLLKEVRGTGPCSGG